MAANTVILGDVTADALKAVDSLESDEGDTSSKLFMAYSGVFYSDDGQVLRAMPRSQLAYEQPRCTGPECPHGEPGASV